MFMVYLGGCEGAVKGSKVAQNVYYTWCSSSVLFLELGLTLSRVSRLPCTYILNNGL